MSPRSTAIGGLILVLLLSYPQDSQEAESEDLEEVYHRVRVLRNRYVSEPNSLVDTHLVDFGSGLTMDSINQNMSTCERDLVRIVASLKEKWAQKMIDADAKPQSGLLVGNYMWFGDFYECRSVVAPPSKMGESFIGQYCSLGFSANVTPTASVALPFKIGLCLPSTCDGKQVANAINSGYLEMRSIVKQLYSLPALNASIACQPKSQTYDDAAIATICVLSLFGVVIAIGTSLTVVELMFPKKKPDDDPSLEINYSIIDHDTLKNSDDSQLITEVLPRNSKVKDFLKCFCLITNASKILSVEARNDLLCVHGIRFLSMTWVILGHTYAFSMTGGVSGNMEEVRDIADTFAFQAILQGTYSVDSFFLLSGFLLTYLFLKEINTKGKVNWVLFYVHRYLRLTPIYALVLAVDTALAIHFGSGPNWPIGVNDPNCRKYWWTNMLYFNNFYDQAYNCMGWSWYLANDMQFYVISPLFLYPLYRWPKIGLSIISLLTVGCWTATGFISAHFKLSAGYITVLNGQPDMMEKIGDYMNKIYIKPYTRIAVYLIGVLLGYFFYQYLQAKKPISKTVVVVGWILAAFGGISIVYAFYHADMSVAGSATYNALNRSIFGASVAWLIFACLTGNGGVVNTILSWKIFLPLSRLTYCAYLIHPIIMMAYYGSFQVTMQITNMFMVTLFFGFLFFSYGTALFVSAAFESSLMAVEKMIFVRRKKD